MIAASYRGHTEVAELLIEHKAEINIANNDGTTALIIAARSGHTEIVEQLLSQSNGDVNATTKAGVSALSVAARSGHTNIVKQLLSQSEIRVNDDGGIGTTALTFAAIKGHTEVVKLLLAYSPKIVGERVNRNAVTKQGCSAIVVAAKFGNTNVFKQLASDAEVDLTISDCDGCTLLYYVIARLSDEDTLRVLRASSYFPDEPLKTTLCRAGPNEFSAIKAGLQDILEKEDIGRQDIEPILFWAVINGAQDLLEKGLKHKLLYLEPFLRGNKVPLHVAARLGNWEVIQVLVDNGADVDSLATHKTTAIHLAAENEPLSTMEKLLNMPTGASSDNSTSYRRQLQRIVQKDSNGEPAISLAVKRRRKLIEDFLWKEFEVYGHRLLAASPSHEEKEEILEIAAKYERPGEESVVMSFLRQNKTSPEGWTALHWAVSESQPLVVWWLLSKGGYARTKPLEEVRKLQSGTQNSSETRNSTDGIIHGLPHNPPPILPSVPNNDDSEIVQKPYLENYDHPELQGTIVDFYSSGEKIEMHFNQKSVKDIIYQQGVKSLMEESRRQNFHKLDFIKEAIQGVQSNESADPPVQQTPKPPNEPEGPSQIRHRAKILAFDPTVMQMTGDIDVSREERFSGPPVFRWVHIPLNDVSNTGHSQRKP